MSRWNRPPLGPNTIAALRPYQREAKDAIFGEWNAGRSSTLAVLATGCHSPEQEILLYDGRVIAANDVQVGDRLMGPDSTPRTVQAVHRGVASMRRIRPIKGEPFDVTWDHKLSLVRTPKSSSPRYPSERGGSVKDVPVHEWEGWLSTTKHLHKLFRVGVDFPEATPYEVMDPYLVGVLLGDGHITERGISVCTPDEEILESCVAAAAEIGVSVVIQGPNTPRTAPSYRFSRLRGTTGANPVVEAAARAGIIGGAADKSVPDELIRGTRADRLEVLAGLIDTDGSLSSASYDYISKSEKLARGVVFLARSLGLAAYVRPCEKFCQTGAGGVYWRAHISGDCDVIPCRVARKKAPPRRQKKDVLRTGFTSEDIGFGNYVGFTVDGDSRYLLGDFTVTHNCGKSMLAANVAREIAETGSNILCLAHTKELVLQMGNWFHRAGMPTGIEMGSSEARAHFDPVGVSATVQTMQGDRLLSWPKGYFTAVIVDECHHCFQGSGYDRVVEHLDPLFVLGLTATPKRNSGGSLMESFDSVAYTYSLLDAVKAAPPGPYLCRPLYSLAQTGIKLGELRKKQSDYSDAHLEERILPHVKEVAQAVVRTNEGRPTIVFVPSVKCAEGVATALQSLGKKADWVSGARPDRDAVMAAMTNGSLDILVNVMVASEGIDIPRVSCVVIARPTKVWGLLVQMLGRATRRHDESRKQDCLMVDLGFITPEHDLLSMPADLFDDHRKPPEVMATAREMIKSRAASGESKIDLADAIEEAEQVVKKKLEWKVKATLEGGKDLKVYKYDPITMASEMLDLPRQPRTAHSIPATEGQARCLENMGLGKIQGLSKSLASTMIDRSMRRKEKGLCTAKQFASLRKAGVPVAEAREMKFHEATAYLNTLWGKR